MARGGATRFQPGVSGNPKGKPKGAITKIGRMDLEQRKALLEECEWLTPLRFLMSVMCCDENPLDVRMEAAKAALPYIHRKMPQAVEFSDPKDIAASLPPMQINFIRKVAAQSREVVQSEEAEVLGTTGSGRKSKPTTAPSGAKPK